ncbi:MAG: hypothetical protein U0414_18370 [Polyangiaceae bacterium]
MGLPEFVSMQQIAKQAAATVIASSLGKTPEGVLQECQRVCPQVGANAILYQALVILRHPNQYGNERYDSVAERLDVLVKARWLVMTEAERADAGGTLEKFLYREVLEIYPPNKLKAPGAFAWVRRWVGFVLPWN